MRKIIILFSLLALLAACKSKKTAKSTAKTVKTEKPVELNVSKISLTEVDNSQKYKAYELGKRILMTCNTSKFKPFTNSEATPSVIKNTTQENLTKKCLKFRLKYGDFKDLQLMEVLQTKDEKSTIFRYKALYEKKIANKELRVTLNEKNQVSAIKSLDWIDLYKG